jgi:hypothetical protein
VSPHLKSKRLNLIAGAPEFSLPAYVVYPVEHDAEVFGRAIEIMHQTAARTRMGH